MSFSKVKQLREAGKLKEAYELALQDYNAGKENVWNKRALAWVYYDLLKNATERNLPEKIMDILKRINDLKPADDEKMFFESIAWNLGKYFNNTQNIDYSLFGGIAGMIKDFKFPQKTASFTFFIKSFLKKCEDKDAGLQFVSQFGFEGFREEDYLKRKLENGSKIISDVEQIFIQVAKFLLKEPVDNRQIDSYLPYFASLCKEHPDMQYPHYYYAKLLLAGGDRKKFLEAFIPFARKKKRDFWVWDLLSEAYDDNDRLYFSCLARSLACGAPVKFSLKVKEKFAGVLLKKGMKAEAKAEINDIIKCRTDNQWKITAGIKKWQADEDLREVVPVKSNKKLYEKYAPQAEAVLYHNLPEHIIVVNGVNRQKSVVYFVASKDVYGSFLLRNARLPAAGDILSARFLPKEDDKSPHFYIPGSLTGTEKQPLSEIYKTVGGVVKIKTGNSFGFVNDVFLTPSFVSENRLKPGDKITVNAVLSYNNKRKSWGWNAVKIKEEKE
jgi:hypothetical protein